MGGLAFAADGLQTPRMPPEVYFAVQQRLESLLKQHFQLVGHALEAPAKSTHGDIDILVCDAFDRTLSHPSVIGEFLSKLVGAAKWKRMGGSSTYNLALPWPEEFGTEVRHVADRDNASEITNEKPREASPASPRPSQASSMDEQGLGGINSDLATLTMQDLPTPANGTTRPSTKDMTCYIQVDVDIMPTPTYFHWHIFYHAHGDLWQILGGIIRRFGLTITSKGLCLRIQEVEKHNKERARVYTTQDPDIVLDYMGLDKERFWRPFSSLDEILDYVASCRFHNPAQWRDRDETDEKAHSKTKVELCEDDQPPSLKSGQRDEIMASSGVKALKHNDRQRAAKRPAFGYWIDKYLPAHVDDQPGRSAALSREEVIVDVKEYFGPEFAETFEARKNKWARLIGVDQLWADIRKSLPLEGTDIRFVMKGMKREIAGKDIDRAFIDEVDGLEGARKAFVESRFANVLKWARDNWYDVGGRQKKTDKEKCSAHLREKIKQEKLATRLA